jgi:glycosyltransferase involved in cell wall biosynthesis
MTRRSDIAIYAPGASAYYELRDDRGQGVPYGGGGAELQTAQLASELAKRGLTVAHIVFPVERPIALEPALELVQRRRRDRGRRLQAFSEALVVWRALRDANARLYVLRGGGSMLTVVGAAFCLLHRRRLVHSVSNDFDLITRSDRSRFGQALSRFVRRHADRIVVQTGQQLHLARAAGIDEARLELIPSFAQPAPPTDPSAEPEAFLWIGRVVPYKLPFRFLKLAEALPEAQFRMIAVATEETPETLMREIVETAEGLPNFELLPRQWRETVLDLISHASAVVVTSEYEGMPNVFLEAWGRGVPVLSLHFDPDGVIAEKGLGVTARGSWAEFVDGARMLWIDRRSRAEIGERGRRHVASVHSLEAVGSRWAETVREAMSA